MKHLLLLASLLATAASLSASPSFIIYSKGDYSPVTATVPATKPTDPDRAAFLAGVQAELAQPVGYTTHMTLIHAPDWGKTVPGADGTIKFHDTFKGGFVVELKLEGLTPGQSYRLCLNGNPKLAGNDLLVDAVPGNPAERYYDFFTATPDAAGRYAATFAIALPVGAYDLRFYVKDTSDFKIILYHDYFRFAVE